jgi:hypothetical protein
VVGNLQSLILIDGECIFWHWWRPRVETALSKWNSRLPRYIYIHVIGNSLRKRYVWRYTQYLTVLFFQIDISFTWQQGCQIVYLQTKNCNLGTFWTVLQWKMLVYFMTIWSILRTFDIFFGHLVYFCRNLVHSPHFGILH